MQPSGDGKVGPENVAQPTGPIRKFEQMPLSKRTLKALTESKFTRMTDIQRASLLQ